ncbi:hypothetical protein ACIRF8_03090 [Streptomyces sp. NPDC102406]|uniref:hypothetical protein n=1 Tax=Streptomyces sp. NPDC102406 TaxID=3366171 RepID=UPI0038230FE4
MPRHERDFTVLANKAIRDPRLSHTARGILVYVLSLPSGAQVNVRTLSDGFPQGRIAVAKAVKELRELGYWVTRTAREPATRRIVSSVDVYEVPQQPAQAGTRPAPPTPVVTEPVPGRPGTGGPGRFFPRGKDNPYNQGKKNPPYPPAQALAAQTPAAPAPTAAAPTAAAPTAAAPSAREGEGARILWRLGDVDARLRLSERGVRELVPEVVAWLERGASAAEVIDAVTAGLPDRVYSAARLVGDRLTRKRPERKRAWRQVYECPECRDPLPWGQETGGCRSSECREAAALQPA